MSFLGFRRRGGREHERDRPERDWGERTRDWGEQRSGSDERFGRHRAQGRDIGDYYGPERFGAEGRRADRNRGEWRDERQREWPGSSRGRGESFARPSGDENYGRPSDDENYRRQSANDRWQESYGPHAGGRSGGFSYRGSMSEEYGERDREQGTHGAYWSPERTSFSDFGRGGEMSTYGSGQFRGKGPKGYRRSDERIREDVCECLTEDERIDATNVEVQVKECEVTLTGTVNSREEKRRAEDLIDRLPGVRDVNNNLRVVNEGGMVRQESTQTRQSTQSGMRGTEQGSRH